VIHERLRLAPDVFYEALDGVDADGG
jgi:hypothetical protein